MRLNVCARALTSSPPLSSARTSVRPSPSARAASSSDRSRLRAGRKISERDHHRADARAGARPTRSASGRARAAAPRSAAVRRRRDQADLRAADDDGRDVHRPAGPAAAAARPPAHEVGRRFPRWGSAGASPGSGGGPIRSPNRSRSPNLVAALGSGRRVQGGGRRRRSPNPGGSTPGRLMARRPSRMTTANAWVTSPYRSPTNACDVEGRILGERLRELARDLSASCCGVRLAVDSAKRPVSQRNSIALHERAATASIATKPSAMRQ